MKGGGCYDVFTFLEKKDILTLAEEEKRYFDFSRRGKKRYFDLSRERRRKKPPYPAGSPPS